MQEKIKGFYVVEGMDGSGKTTFCNLLKSSIEKSGRSCIILNESEDPAFTKAIREVLQSDKVSATAEAYLFAAARANCVSQMKSFLLHHKDSIVIFDRYVPSSYVYQTEKVPIDEVKHINSKFPFPEVVFWLDINADKALKRIVSRNEKIEKYEKSDLLKKWRQKYTEVLSDRTSDISYCPSFPISDMRIGGLALSSTSPEEYSQVPFIVKIDASLEPDQMLDEAFSKYNIL